MSVSAVVDLYCLSSLICQRTLRGMFFSKNGTHRNSKDVKEGSMLPTHAGGVTVSLDCQSSMDKQLGNKSKHRAKGGVAPVWRWNWSRGRIVSAIVVGMLVLHVLGASYVAPRMISRVAEQEGGRAGLYDFISSLSLSSRTGIDGASNVVKRRTSSKDSGTLVSRLSKRLSETAASLHLHQLHQLLESKNSEAAILGGDISKVLRIRDGLKNPLNKLPTDPREIDAMREGGHEEEWERWIKVHKAPSLVTLYEEKCDLDDGEEKGDGTGEGFVMSSRSWVKRYGDDVVKYKWCRGGRVEEVPQLERVLILRSNRDLPLNAVTIVTQLSIERLAMLEQQCAHWPHPIAAVVYIPLVRGKISSTEDESWNGTSLEVGIEEVKTYAERMKTSKCIIDIELVVEERCSFEQATLYPTNAVRNRALIMSRSDIVLLLDVDFVVDQSLALDLEDETRHGQLTDMLASGAAIVLPAFEAWDQSDRGKKIALTAVIEGKVRNCFECCCFIVDDDPRPGTL